MLSWRLYYADGSTFDSDDGSWEDAPTRGVMCVVTPDELVGREVDWGKDVYLWWPGAEKPWGADLFGLYDYLQELGSKNAGKPLSRLSLRKLADDGVKFGRSVSNTMFVDILNRAVADPDFAPKSAWLPTETTPPYQTP